MAAFEIEQGADHDGVRLVARPRGWAALLGRRRSVLTLTTRELEVGALRLRIEDIHMVVEGVGTVRLSTGKKLFEVGHDWPPEASGPERRPPEALEALRRR